jgi:hypothetical protein
MSKGLPPRESPPASGAGAKTSVSRWGRGFLLGQLVGTVFGPFIRLIAAVLLGAAAVFLVGAWQSGPQQAVDAARYAKYTKQVQGTIVESWVALELDTTDIPVDENWPASSLAAPCAVVEYAGDWGPPARRAFCGKRLAFSSEYYLHDLTELTSGVPFAWARDASGFIVPEIRVSAVAREWLATHGYDTFMHAKWPAKSALDELRIELDRPVDYAVAGWIAPAATIPLALDPQRPAEAMPSAFAAAHRHWQPLGLIVGVIFGAMGLAVWFEGMTVLLGENMALPARVLIAVLPLLALPWWGEYLPHALVHLNPKWGSMMSDILREMGDVDRLVASDPADATLAGGERLLWRSGESIYADTFGRLHYTPPQPAPGSADAALAALAASVTTQTRALSAAERVEIFSRLKRDSEHDLMSGGIVFLPAAKEATLDPNSSAAMRHAAMAFVSARLDAQFDRPYPRDLGYQERERLYEEARKLEASQ